MGYSFGQLWNKFLTDGSRPMLISMISTDVETDDFVETLIGISSQRAGKRQADICPN